jgi:hypothetical protein
MYEKQNINISQQTEQVLNVKKSLSLTRRGDTVQDCYTDELFI